MRFKIFDSYFLVIDSNTHRIFIVSIKRRIEKILKATVRENNSYYSFYQNGNKKEYSLKDLVEKALGAQSFEHRVAFRLSDGIDC